MSWYKSIKNAALALTVGVNVWAFSDSLAKNIEARTEGGYAQPSYSQEYKGKNVLIESKADVPHYLRGIRSDISDRIDRMEYKRRQAPLGVKITPKAFGKDRRLPITNRYVPR